MYQKNDDIGFLLKRISSALEREFNRNLQQYGLTVAQLHILGYLRRHSGQNVTQKEIEDYMEVSHPTTVGLIKRLEAKGLVSTELVTSGRFQKIVRETDKAEKFHLEIEAGHVRSEKVLARGFSDQEQAELLSYLNRVLANVQGELPVHPGCCAAGGKTERERCGRPAGGNFCKEKAGNENFCKEISGDVNFSKEKPAAENFSKEAAGESGERSHGN